MSNNLHIKFIVGPVNGHLYTGQVTRTTNINTLIDQLLLALGESGVKATRNELALIVRKTDKESAYVDGLITAPKCLGYFIVGEEQRLTRETVESIVKVGLDHKQIQRAFKQRSSRLLFQRPVLPTFQDCPNPYQELWAPVTGLIRPISTRPDLYAN
jgi:hypothetical protein